MERPSPLSFSVAVWMWWSVPALMLVAGRDGNDPGFISIDCGATTDRNDTALNLYYQKDNEYVESGENKMISADYITPAQNTAMTTLRVFPNGTRNCYTVAPTKMMDNEGGKFFLIRASFFYGNYDGKNMTPTFDLYLGVNFWETIDFNGDPGNTISREIIRTVPPTSNVIQVCLVRTGDGIPFISALELRQLNDSMYLTSDSSFPLALATRLNIGSNDSFRHPYDAHDRIWYADETNYANRAKPGSWNDSSPFPFVRTSDAYNVPDVVLQTWVAGVFGINSSFSLPWSANYPQAKTWIAYFHFADLVDDTSRRRFTIFITGFSQTANLDYGVPVTYQTNPFTTGISFTFLIANDGSATSVNLPPILNAFELYYLLDASATTTSAYDVEAMYAIKNSYNVIKDSWQGDPCVPTNFTWDGVNCSAENPPRVISLNLSYIGLKGNIPNSLANLTALVYLNLSHNLLTGSVPGFLAKLPNLKIIDLSANNLSGSVPSDLVKKADAGTLQLHLDGNQKLCRSGSCGLSRTIISVIIGIVVLTSTGMIGSAIWMWMVYRKKRKETTGLTDAAEIKLSQSNLEASSISNKVREVPVISREPSGISRKERYTSAEVEKIIDCFIVDGRKTVIGEGGYGKVYKGKLEDDTVVAVKMLSKSSNQGTKQFLAEAKLLLKIDHKNLVRLLGYCDEPETEALIYEFMPKGNLLELLDPPSGTSNRDFLIWDHRLNFAVDIANGLNYLHNECSDEIIHRDIKPANILIDDKYQAKISDFGLSKILSSKKTYSVEASVVGTPGYMDPAYLKNKSCSKENDAYSFGIVLHQLVSGSDWELVDLDALEYQRENYIEKIIDKRLEGQYDVPSASDMLKIASSCVRDEVATRPNIEEVFKNLKESRDNYEKLWKTRGGSNHNHQDVIPLRNSSVYYNSTDDDHSSEIDSMPLNNATDSASFHWS